MANFSRFKNWIFIGLFIVMAVTLVHLRFNFFDWNNKRQITEQASILVEKIKEVTKLITIEGHFSEIYSYDDFYWYNITPFRKKVLIRVKAKVSMGYDFEKLSVISYPDEKRIVLSNLPEIEIISIDHDLDYYDLQEGVFNHFGESDLTKASTNAKEFIREKVLESDLKDKAELQGFKMIEFIKSIVDSQDWTLEILEEVTPPALAN